MPGKQARFARRQTPCPAYRLRLTRTGSAPGVPRQPQSLFHCLGDTHCPTFFQSGPVLPDVRAGGGNDRPRRRRRRAARLAAPPPDADDHFPRCRGDEAEHGALFCSRGDRARFIAGKRGGCSEAGRVRERRSSLREPGCPRRRGDFVRGLVRVEGWHRPGVHPRRFYPAGSVAGKDGPGHRAGLRASWCVANPDGRAGPAPLAPRKGWLWLASLIGVAALLGYVYRTPALDRLPDHTSVAVHTAWLFIVLGTGTVFVRPDEGLMGVITSEHGGGAMSRRILPFAVTLPFVLRWLREWGQHAGWFGMDLGLVLSLLSNVVILTTLIWFAARAFNRFDANRQSAEVSLAQAHAEFGTTRRRSHHGAGHGDQAVRGSARRGDRRVDHRQRCQRAHHVIQRRRAADARLPGRRSDGKVRAGNLPSGVRSRCPRAAIDAGTRSARLGVRRFRGTRAAGRAGITGMDVSAQGRPPAHRHAGRDRHLPMQRARSPATSPSPRT